MDGQQVAHWTVFLLMAFRWLTSCVKTGLTFFLHTTFWFDWWWCHGNLCLITWFIAYALTFSFLRVITASYCIISSWTRYCFQEKVLISNIKQAAFILKKANILSQDSVCYSFKNMETSGIVTLCVCETVDQVINVVMK